MKIGLERINTQKGIIVEVLLDNKMIGLVISSEFIRKQVFKLKKMERLYMSRSLTVDSILFLLFMIFYFSFPLGLFFYF